MDGYIKLQRAERKRLIDLTKLILNFVLNKRHHKQN